MRVRSVAYDDHSTRTAGPATIAGSTAAAPLAHRGRYRGLRLADPPRAEHDQG